VLALGSHGRLLDTFHDTRILRRVIPLLDLAALRWPQLTRFAWRLSCGSELSYQLATHLEVNGPLMEREDLSPYFDHLAGLDPQLFLSMLRNAGRHSVYDHLPSIAVPTLILAGTNDTFTPSWLSEEMHDRIPDSEMLTIPGGTHVALLEQPELIQLRLERFLLRVGLPPRTGQELHSEPRDVARTSGAEP
jgi:pimeloyl-ACP methyl ester carboxylesterase